MVRVPNARSKPISDDGLFWIAEPPSFANLTPAEMDQLIRSCGQMMREHAWSSRSRNPEIASEAKEHHDATRTLLLHLQLSAPEPQRLKIEAILKKHQA